MLRFLLFLLLSTLDARAEEFLPKAKRILFLGDSITHAGGYVNAFELYLLRHHPERNFAVINCGLPSETVSGLSEAGHADGKFPRPHLHERLDRVLATVKPDVVFACYGMNCGIYLPFDEARFAKYREGMEKLRAKVKAAGADIIHLTPPVFDPVPLKGRVRPAELVKDGEQSENYDAALTSYSAWLMEQSRNHGWRVIDVHSAMSNALQDRRRTDPTFTFARDGVHADAEGHHVIARAIIGGFGVDFDLGNAAYLPALEKIRARGRILTGAYLSAAGHQRPGMRKGLPLGEAEAKAAEIKPESALPSPAPK